MMSEVADEGFFNENDAYVRRVQLPGHDPYLRCFDDAVGFIPFYRFEQDSIHIRDPIWGECTIGDKPGDEVLLRLLDNDLVRRSMSIEQLTLDPYMSTIPNTSHFSRWEHLWGSVVFVRKIIEQNNLQLDDRQALILQLRTFVSDLGHTSFSHLGDWMFQGFGGSEDQHDMELGELLKVSGIEEILTEAGIALDEVVFPEGQDWIECDSPDLCVDRLDYSVREMNRWQTRMHMLEHVKGADNYVVDDNGRLIVKSEAAALSLFKGFSLLATEHWYEPVHRLQLMLLEELVKRNFVGHHNLVVEWPLAQGFHPRDYMYSVDQDFLSNMHTSDPFMWTLQPIARDIGREQRNIFVTRRMRMLGEYISQFVNDPYPEPGVMDTFRGMPLHSSRVGIIPVNEQTEVADFGANPYTVDFFLKPLKPRKIDPLYLDKSGEVQRLSDTNEAVRADMEAQRRIMAQAYVARLIVTPDYKAIIDQGRAENRDEWVHHLEKPRMNAQEFKRLLGEVTLMTSLNFIDMQWLR
jgi:hypothetical protein